MEPVKVLALKKGGIQKLKSKIYYKLTKLNIFLHRKYRILIIFSVLLNNFYVFGCRIF